MEIFFLREGKFFASWRKFLRFVKSYQFELKKTEGSKLFFELKLTPSEAGNHKVSFRVFPQHKELPHRMDFAYVRWIQL